MHESMPESPARHAAGELIVSTVAMREILDDLALIAPTTLSVLLLGETGTGKEVLAEWIHRNSRRADRPLVKTNCAGLTESVVESELFGHERGAFTGAVAAHKGLFETAHGGCLFLDEIAELPARTQAKLLRVLESGEFARVGSTQLHRVNVRIIAATHRDLPQLVQQGEFRQDLYFRLNAVAVRIPPLRERSSEIAPLARMFLARTAARLGRPSLELSDEALHELGRHAWPGNIRELRNTIERAAALCPGSIVEAGLLGLPKPEETRSNDSEATAPVAPERGADMRSSVRAYERSQIIAVLNQTGGNQTLAAQFLGVSRRTLTNKLKAYCISRPRKRADLDPDQAGASRDRSASES